MTRIKPFEQNRRNKGDKHATDKHQSDNVGLKGTDGIYIL